MDKFEYFNPVKVVFGEGSLKQIGKEASVYGKRALLVSYTIVSFFQNAIDTIKESLAKEGIEVFECFNVTPNPTLNSVREGVELIKKHKIDFLIGLGGGSAMDATKVMAAGALYGDDVSKMIMFSHSNVTSVPPKVAMPTIMVPTLPATGSEMNPTAVVTEPETKRKSYVWTPCLYPKVAIMDPELTKSLPPYQTACGAFDIFAHIMEAYVNPIPNVNLDLQDRMQEGVMKCVLETIPKVFENPTDLQLRGVLMWAASIGLNGWLTSGTFGFTPMHQMGHVLSSHYGATHGATLACMMHTWMRYFATRPDNERYQQLAYRIFDCPLLEAADKFEKIMRERGVQTRIHEFGAEKDDIDELTNAVVEISFGPDGKLPGHPQMTKEDIKKLFELSY